MAKRRFSRKGRKASNVRSQVENARRSFDSFIEGDLDFFKPSEGTNKIRILPGRGEEEDNFGLPIHLHYQVGPDSSTYICPERTKLGDEEERPACPVCTEYKRVRNTADQEYLNQLRPKFKLLAYLINRNDEDQEVQIWAMPNGFYDDLMDYATDEDTDALLPFDDPYEGYDVSFKVNNAGKFNAEYRKIKFAKEETPVFDDEDDNEEVVNFLLENPLDSVVKIYDPEHIQKKFMAGAEEEDEDEEEESPRRRRRARRQRAKEEEPDEDEESESDEDEDEGEPEPEKEEPEEEEDEDPEDEKQSAQARLKKYKKKTKKKKKTARK